MVADGHRLHRRYAPAEGSKPPKRLAMVPWASPDVLKRAAVRAILGPLFGRFADKRDIIAALDEKPIPTPVPTPSEDLWVDFVADTGEGFDSTYTVARIVSEPRLPLALAPDHTKPTEGLPRGKILLFGGDEVYPYAEPAAYRNRLEMPWDMAPPSGAPLSDEHRVYAIPGNHDWYDGLSTFMRAFNRRRRIGGRRVMQGRSYFAVPLAHGWWAWGVDFQFSGFVDDAQMDYFRVVAEKQMAPSSRVLLVVPEPSWIFTEQAPAAYGVVAGMRAIDYLEDTVVAKHGHTVRAVLTGDLHHYARYEEVVKAGDEDVAAEAEGSSDPKRARPTAGRPWIVCGGGGAALHGTHDLPQEIDLRKPGRYGSLKLRHAYPETGASRRRSWRAVGLALLSPPAAVLVGALAALLAWVLGGALHAVLGALPLTLESAGEAADALGNALFTHPIALVAVLGVVAAFVLAADVRGAAKLAVGGIHFLAHAAAFFVLLWAACRAAAVFPAESRVVVGSIGALALLAALLRVLASRPRTLDARGLAGAGVAFLLVGLLAKNDAGTEYSLRALALLLPAAAVVHATILGGYLALSSLCGRHVGPAFACQAIPDEKGFLRILVTRDALTIYPIRIPKVCRRWVWTPPTAGQWKGRYEPAAGAASLPTFARLAEPPIRVVT